MALRIEKLSIKLLFILNLASLSYLKGKTQTCDSLYSILEIAWELKDSDYRDAIRNVTLVINSSAIQHCQQVEGTAYNYWGVILRERGFYEEAQNKLKISLEKRISLMDSVGAAGVLNNLSLAQLGQGDYISAVRSAIRGVKILEQLGRKERLAQLYNTLSIIYEKTGVPTKSILYNHKALDLLYASLDTINIANSKYDLANKYYNYENLDSAEFYYQGALPLFSWSRDSLGIAMCNEAIGNIAVKKKMFSKAKEYLSISRQIYSKTNDTFGLFYSYYNFSNYHLKKGEFNEATEECKRASKLLPSFGGLENHADLNELYRKIYEAKGDYENALIYSDKTKDLQDSIFNLENAKQIQEIQTKYDTEKLKREKAEKEIESKAKTIQFNQLLGGTTIILLTAVGIIIFIYRKRTMEKIISSQKIEIAENKLNDTLKRQELKFIAERLQGRELERRAFYEELHHNISNKLLTIIWDYRGMVEENAKIGSIATAIKVAKSLNGVYEEIRTLHNKIGTGNVKRIGVEAAISDLCQTISNAGKIRILSSFHGGFDYLDNHLEVWLYRITQELIGNVLKHASASEIELTLNQHKEKISLIVADNGIGFDTSKSTKGTGLFNLKAKVESMDGTFLVDTGKGSGTTVIVSIPFENLNVGADGTL